jgi:hypothetical protein
LGLENIAHPAFVILLNCSNLAVLFMKATAKQASGIAQMRGRWAKFFGFKAKN